MSTTTAAADAATTDWTTYDGGVLPDFVGIAVVFPVAMAIFLVLPAAICYCCLSRRRVVPYAPPNMVGGGDLGRPPPPSDEGSITWEGFSFAADRPWVQIGKARMMDRHITRRSRRSRLAA